MAEQQQTVAYLVYRTGQEPKQLLIWDTVDISVGRRKSQDLMVSDSEVSREHALFCREGQRHLVKDLGSGLGTTVNGEPISERALTHGDVVRIGDFEAIFGLREGPVQPGRQLRFASQLKDLLGAAGAGDRTMIGFDSEDEFAIPTVGALGDGPSISGPRALSADGLPEDRCEQSILGLSISSLEGVVSSVRDLDSQVAAELSLGTATEQLGAGPGQTLTVGVELQIDDPSPQLEALLASLVERPIALPGLRARVRVSRR